VYSKELNVATKSEGITNPNAKIWDSEKNLVREHAKVVNNQALIESGLANATEVHEIGHVVTHDHLQKGIPDPQGIIYRAQDGKVLFTTEERPNFYLKDGPSDEVRQFAFNIQNALHQRHTGELMEDFRRKEMISVSDVYGVNRENFLQALDSANEFANGLEIFHIRNSNLAQNARQKILENIRGDKLDPAHFSVYRFDSDPTFAFFRVILPEGKVDIPIVGEAFKSFVAPVEIPAVLADDGSTKTIRKYPYENFPGDAAELKDYALNYLQNELSMLDAQKIPLEKTLEKISELQKNPNRLMTRQEYFENRNLFIQVKKSVNLTPEKMLNLDWVIPHGNVKFRTKKLPIPTDPNYRPKFQFYNPKTTPKRASEN
jgi:hypothetical protein